MVGALDDKRGRPVGIYRNGAETMLMVGVVTVARFTPADLTALIGYLTEAQSDATLAELTND